MTAAKRLCNVLEQQVQESDTNQFEVGEQIERNYRYYTLQPLGTEMRGRSHYVSPDVLDYVEQVKALFKETFLSNRQTVQFSSNGMSPQGECDAKTAYVNLMLDKNKKERLFSDFWHDAFLAKRGVVLVEWEPDTTPVNVQVQGATQEQIMQIAAQAGDGLAQDGLALSVQGLVELPLGDVHHPDLEHLISFSVVHQVMQPTPRAFHLLEIFVMQNVIDLFSQFLVDLSNNALDRAQCIVRNQVGVRQRLFGQCLDRGFNRRLGLIGFRTELFLQQRGEIAF